MEEVYPRRYLTIPPKIGRDLLPLHAFCVIDLGGRPSSFFPYSHCPVPTATDELEASRAPVAGHDRGYVPLVYLRGGGERADVKRVEIVVLRREKHRRRECRRPR